MSRVVFAGGIHGTLEERAIAHRCCWCKPMHFMTDADRRLAEQGARISDGLCPVAYEQTMADIDREDDR